MSVLIVNESGKNPPIESNIVSDSITTPVDVKHVETIEAPLTPLQNYSSPSIYLVETFYISSKKNTVFQVRLTEKGLCLRKESNGTSKEQTILLKYIIGCRCLRSKRKKTNGSGCACTALPVGQAQLKVVDDNSGDMDSSDISAYLYIYAYIIKKTRRGERRERTTITLRFRSFDKYEENYKEAQKWRVAIKQLLLTKEPSIDLSLRDTRKVLIILNPKSGSGKARETFQQRVVPIFNEAELPYDLHVTKHANYAREFVRNRDIFQWRSIVAVGGDGIFYEMLNGLFERTDWERAFADIKLGIIPCGSGNGLARSIAHVCNDPYEPKPVLSSALTIVRGYDVPMDLVRVETRSQIMFSFLSVGWGLISDIDIESECLRLIGYQRFALWTFHRLISLRKYHGTVSYLPAINVKFDQKQNSQRNSEQQQQNSIKTTLKHSLSCNTTLDCMDCHGEGDCEACDSEFGDVMSFETTSGFTGTINNGINEPYRPRLDSWYSANSKKSAYFSTADSVYQSISEKISIADSHMDASTSSKKQTQIYGPGSKIPAITAPLPNTANWIVESGEFIMVHAAYQTHLGSDCLFAPQSQLNDGVIWLCIIKSGVSRQDLFKFLLGLSTGTHLPTTPNEYIKMISVTAFRIEPQALNSSEITNGHITVDGELVEYGPIQAEIFPGMAKLLVPNNSS